MSSVAISGNASGSGALTIAAPNTNSNFTVTLPINTATLGIDGPAFSAYAGSSTTLTNNAETKVLFDTEEFDTNSNFASSRFTPTVAGYYQINAAIRIQSVASGNTVYIVLHKNGSAYKLGNLVIQPNTADPIFVVTSVVYMNGSTDYLEIYGFQNSGSTKTTQASSGTTYFNGAMIRGA
jgi:hypothetical protein